MKDEDPTTVVFRKAKFKDGEEVVAFFPEAEANWGRIACYTHDGQHSEADYMFYLDDTRKCDEAEYAPLKKELEEEFGYDLRVLKRIPSGTVQSHWK